jgi:hypothetical protein
MMAKLKGSHPWALILCNASDQSPPRWPGLDYFESLIASPGGGGLYTWWHEVSGGKLDLAGSKVFGWYRLSNTLAEVRGMGGGAQVAAAHNAAKKAGDDVSGYRHTLMIVTSVGGPGGNVGADVVASISTTGGQAGWRHCAKCEGIAFWNGVRDPGFCVAGDRHDHSHSGYYSLYHDTSFASGQNGWRWCNKCEALIFNTATPAPCPGGDRHVLGGSADYVLRADTSADIVKPYGGVPVGFGLTMNAIAAAQDAAEQKNLHWCKQCQALSFWDGSPSRKLGPCPVSATGRHEIAGGNYGIPFEWAASLTFLAHETGHAFGLQHAFGRNRTGDFFSDSRPGAYDDTTDPMGNAGPAGFAVPLYTPGAAGLSAPTLHKFGWLSGGEVTTVVSPATDSVALQPLYGGTAGETPRMIRVIQPTQDRIYTAEYRVPKSWDQGFKTPRVVIHAMRTLYQAGQDGWRWCKNCEGLIYAGRTACPAGGVHDGSESGDYWLSLDAGPSAGQGGWRWCSNCSGLFFTGGAWPVCPAGVSHDGSHSGDYELASSGDGDSNWRRCTKCQGLASVGSNVPSVCPAGGLHDHSDSGTYVLLPLGGSKSQNKWRRCNKCRGLYYARLGACSGGDTHEFSDDDYALVHDLDGASGQSGWRHCSKCRGLAFKGESRPAGACAAGGQHDHAASGHYVLPFDVEVGASQRRWWSCKQCSVLHYLDDARGPGPCPAGGNHDKLREYIVPHDTTAVAGATGFHWCRKCEGMVIGNSPATCVKGGSHATSTENYTVRTDPASLNREQAFWRTCKNCSALFALNSVDGKKEKPCASGGTHAPADNEYFLTFVTPDPFWRWCSKCESIAMWDGSRPPGPCPGGERHDHSNSRFYIPPNFALDVTQLVAELVADDVVLRGSWSDPSKRVRIDVSAMDADSATVMVTAT